MGIFKEFLMYIFEKPKKRKYIGKVKKHRNKKTKWNKIRSKTSVYGDPVSFRVRAGLTDKHYYEYFGKNRSRKELKLTKQYLKTHS